MLGENDVESCCLSLFLPYFLSFSGILSYLTTLTEMMEENEVIYILSMLIR